jgi:hypothetical protein
MSKRKTVSTIFNGDVIFKTHDSEFDFDIHKMANSFASTISFFAPQLDLHWKDTTGFTIENKVLKLSAQYSWITVRTEESIASGVHYIELQVILSQENAFLVGVVTKDFFNKGSNAYITGEHGYGLYLPDGQLYNKDTWKPYTTPTNNAAKDTKVGLILNMEDHTLAFVLNDIIQPQAFSKLPNELYIAVSVIHKGDTIRFNEVDSYKRFQMTHGIGVKSEPVKK